MARLPKISNREDVPPGGEEAFDYVVASRGFARAPFSIMLYSPEMAQRIAHLGSHMGQLELPKPWRRLAILAAVRECDCHYEWGVMNLSAVEEGVRPEAIALIADKAPLESFTAEEAKVVRFVRELLRDRWVSQQAFDDAKGIFGERGLVELTGAIGYYGMIALTLNCFELEPLPHFTPPPWKKT